MRGNLASRELASWLDSKWDICKASDKTPIRLPLKFEVVLNANSNAATARAVQLQKCSLGQQEGEGGKRGGSTCIQ